MPRPLRQELRDEILQAAATAFARVGLRGVSLEQIAKDLSVSKGAIYFHFRSKTELFLQALERLHARKKLALAQARSLTGPLIRLEALLRASLEFSLARPELRRMQWILDTELSADVASALREGVRSEQRSMRSELRQILQQAARSGQLLLTDPAAEAFRLLACLEGTLSQHQAGAEDVALFLDPQALVMEWLAEYYTKRPRRQRSSAERSSGRERTGEDFQPAF